MARLRSAPSAPPPTSNATATNTRAALREKTNTTRPTHAKAPANTAERDGGDFVKEAAKPRRGRGKPAAQHETTLTMAGGLGQRDATVPADDDGDTIRVAQSDNLMTTDELAKSDAPPLPAAKSGRRPPRMTRKPVHTEAQSKVLDGLKKRMQAAARGEAGGAKAAQAPKEAIETSSDPPPTKPSAKRKSAASGVERSEFSISPSPPPPGKLSSVHKRTSVAPPGSVVKVHGTPAVETSILALKNFKRRPRQGSMLAMVQQRTASARPSLAVTRREEDASVFDLDDASDDEDDFAPEAEGTPLQLSKANKPVSAKRTQTPAKIASPATVANTKKRKSDGLDDSHSALDALRTKRHKSDIAPLEDSAPIPMEDDYEPARPLSSERQMTPQPQPTSDVQVLNSSPQPSSTPPTEPSSTEKRGAVNSQDFAVPSTEEQEKQAAEEQDDEDELADDFAPNATMAEPASSLAGSPIPGTQQTDVFADPLTQFSPPPPPRQTKAKPKAKAVSTATLQSLLPKRRQRAQPRGRRTEYDISSDDDEDAQLDASHLDEDEDELGGRLRRRMLKATPVKSTKAKAKSRQSKAPLSARKSTAPNPKDKATRTYGRKNRPAATSDKENEQYESASEDEDVSSVHVTQAVNKSKELEAARKKFEEVDEWDMSFESMSAEDHRSSSQGWR